MFIVCYQEVQLKLCTKLIFLNYSCFEFHSLCDSFQLSLWGNRCDLSISAGRDNSQTANPLKQVGQLDELILADDFNNLWDYLRSLRAKTKTGAKVRIDIILDNAGINFIRNCSLLITILLPKLSLTCNGNVDYYYYYILF